MQATMTKPPANPAGPSPLRRPGSIRRTSTIHVDWPEGIDTPLRAIGHARDLFTPLTGGDGEVVAEDRSEIMGSVRREVMSIATSRRNDDAQKLIGGRAGGYLRAHLANELPQEKADATPLYLLLDDFSGASLVSGWAWSRWPEWKDWVNAMSSGARRQRPVSNVCSGWRDGARVLDHDDPTDPAIQSTAAANALPHPDDPRGWHELPEQTGAGLRRARRLDVWWEDGVVRIDVGFQDSGSSPEGRISVHEYQVQATADPETFNLSSLDVQAHVLPYSECLEALPNVNGMLGKSLEDFRLSVSATLPGVLGCTHLNDVLRSMADVPQLARRLKALNT